MSVATLCACHNNGDNWVLHLVPLKNQGLVGAFSDGSLKLYPLDGNPGRDFMPSRTIRAHESSINSLKSVDGSDIVASASDDGVKIFDLRNSTDKPVATFHNERNIPFLSLDVKNHLIAAGTELKGSDAELHIWDLRSNSLVRKFVDSHHDDITDIKFHPSNDSLLLSGSTDGYVNIYDLDILEEEDALHQVINFASIHSAGWLGPKRIYTLSHMETFAIHELNDKTDISSEPEPHSFGDVRDAWNCEYVVDLYPGFVATGTNSGSIARLYPFANEEIDLKNSVNLNGGHGEEVIRSVYAPQNSNLIYTGGEDGNLRVWKSDVILNSSGSVFSSSTKTETQVLPNQDYEDIKIDSSSETDSEEEEAKRKAKKQLKREKKEKKRKREKKELKEKKDKKEKKDHRFRPY